MRGPLGGEECGLLSGHTTSALLKVKSSQSLGISRRKLLRGEGQTDPNDGSSAVCGLTAHIRLHLGHYKLRRTPTLHTDPHLLPQVTITSPVRSQLLLHHLRREHAHSQSAPRSATDTQRPQPIGASLSQQPPSFRFSPQPISARLSQHLSQAGSDVYRERPCLPGRRKWCARSVSGLHILR